MKTQDQRQSSNVEDKRLTHKDREQGYKTSQDKYSAAPKGNRPRYDAAVSKIKQAYTERSLNANMDHIQDMLKGLK